MVLSSFKLLNLNKSYCIRFFRIELFNVQENFSVKMYDASGKLVFEKTNNSATTDIDATGFENGMYFVTILTDSGLQFLEKVMKN